MHTSNPKTTTFNLTEREAELSLGLLRKHQLFSAEDLRRSAPGLTKAAVHRLIERLLQANFVTWAVPQSGAQAARGGADG